MTALQLYRLYLRPGSGPRLTLEVSSDRTIWRETGLSLDLTQGADATASLDALLRDFIEMNEAVDIEAVLPYERQIRIGRQLNAGLFGPNAPPFPRSRLQLVPVIAEDNTKAADDFFDLFLRLPWALLTDKDEADAAFLAWRNAAPTVVTLDGAPRKDGSPRFPEVRLPPWPRILFVCPRKEHPDYPTRGAEHLENLSKLLGPRYEKAQRSNRLKAVSTYAEFVCCLNDDSDGFIPHIVYYYGHAKAEEEETVFKFDPAPGDKTGDHILSDLIGPLRSIIDRINFPPVIWFNACQGGAAKRNNIIRRLAPFASVVIATRQVAVVEDAMGLGETALPLIALEGEAPPLALAKTILPTTRNEPPNAIMAARWATSIVAVQYDLWSALDTEHRDLADAESVGDVPMRLDRKIPLGQIDRYFEEALRQTPETPHTVLWHGLPEDGTEVFAQRFVDRLSEHFADWSAVNFPVELQLSTLPMDPEVHFLECIYRALTKVQAGADVGGVRENNIQTAIDRLSGGQPTLVTFTHGPFTASDIGALQLYLTFWDGLFSNLGLAPERTRIVLGLRFVREEAASELASGENGFEQILLGEVPGDELIEHMQRFYSLYGFNSRTIDKTAVEFMKNNGKHFRPLHLALEKKFRISVWTDRLSEAGDKA